MNGNLKNSGGHLLISAVMMWKFVERLLVLTGSYSFTKEENVSLNAEWQLDDKSYVPGWAFSGCC